MRIYSRNYLAKQLAIPMTLAGGFLIGTGYRTHADDAGQNAARPAPAATDARPAQRDARPAQRDNRTAQRDNRTAQQNNQAEDPHAEDESAALGVVVGSCPGNAVCVLDTIMGSPADEAGLRQGDYIISVDDQQVTSPLELNRMIERLDAGKEVKLTLWRNGQQTQKQVKLAALAEEAPASHRAWLGVRLSPAAKGQPGIVIEQVLRGSPAAEAGLRSSDRITKLGQKDVSDIQSFIESTEDLGPDSEMQLTIDRRGTEHQVAVTLGSWDDAPISFLRQAMGSSRNSKAAHSSRDGDADEAIEMLEQTVDDMRQQLRSLERQVQQLVGEQPEQPQRQSDDDVSILLDRSLSEDETTTLVMQRGFRGGNYGNRYNRSWDNNYYDWRNQYRSGYRTPLNQSPRYGNSYYRYGGQPFYRNYGGGYGYGFGRPGVRIGNLGVYW